MALGLGPRITQVRDLHERPENNAQRGSRPHWIPKPALIRKDKVAYKDTVTDEFYGRANRLATKTVLKTAEPEKALRVQLRPLPPYNKVR